MSTTSLRPALRRLCGVAASRAAADLTDRQLLERFTAWREEDAFAILVRRHAPMVLGVCRRVLPQEQDAEDAFQATFLVLARKAGTLSWHGSVAGWLYQVASRVALKARADAARRRHHERRTEMVPLIDDEDALARHELQALLDEEVRRLPEKYRAVVVLCYLEGKSHAEAARDLGWPAGTVKGRLARARQRLRGRLARRGLGLAAAAVVPLVGRELATAAVPVGLANTAARAAVPFAAGVAVTGVASARAVLLAETVARTLAAGKLRLWALLIALAVLGVGTGLLAAGGQDGQPRQAAAAGAEPAAPRDEKPRGEARARMEVLRERLLERAGGNARSEAAVAAGLDWLARHQAEDGHWSLNGFALDGHCDCAGAGSMKNDTAATAFGLLPFLGAGVSHRGGGPAGQAKVVERGLAYLMKKQTKEGDFGDGMYAQALATMALAEAFGLTADPVLKRPAQRAVDFIVAGQDPQHGGWSYVAGQGRSDTSVTGWQVQALRQAELAGLPVPQQTRDGATRWLDFCEAGGGYGYVGPMPTPSMTASALLCRQAFGWGKRQPTIQQGIGFLERRPPGALKNGYYYYYATQVLYNLGGPRWEKWNRPMRDGLIATQDQGDMPQHAHQKGSWSPEGDAFGPTGGRLMTTAFALRALEVYYQTDLQLAARPPRELNDAELRGLWADLAAAEVPRVRQAVWALVGSPARAVPFLEERVPPAKIAIDRRRLAQAARELDDDRFAVRQKATDDLEKAGELAEPVLRQVLDGKPSPEVRRRAEELLQGIAGSAYAPEWLRLQRALEVLELSGTPEAQQVLEAVARGTPEARLTRAAKASLARVSAKP